MKRAAFLVIAALLSTAVDAGTIAKADLEGVWLEPKSVGPGTRATPNRLEIRKDLSVTLTTYFEAGKSVSEAPSSQVTFAEDLLIIRFGTLGTKLVLSGWKLKDGTKLLFGHLYLYAPEPEGLFNGIPVSFKVDGS